MLILLQHLLATYNVDALLHLADALASNVIDRSILACELNALDASSVVGVEAVEALDRSTDYEVALASSDGVPVALAKPTASPCLARMY